MLTVVVDALTGLVFAAAHFLGGSLGGGLLAVSLGLRFALLPLTVRVARRANAQQAILAGLQPELERLARRYRRQPDVLWRERMVLFRRAGYRPYDPVTLLGGLLQAPPLLALYAVIRRGLAAGSPFLWMANLARPDVALALGTAAVGALGAYLSTRNGSLPQRAGWAACATAVVTLAVCWRASAALALTWGGAAVGNAVQGWLLGRGRHRLPAA